MKYTQVTERSIELTEKDIDTLLKRYDIDEEMIAEECNGDKYEAIEALLDEVFAVDYIDLVREFKCEFKSDCYLSGIGE